MGTAIEAHARNHRRLGKADDELVGWFAAAIGVRAQSYERGGTSAFDSNAAHGERLRAFEQGRLSWFDRVGRTLGHLDSEHRRLLALVYAPAGRPFELWIADALSTPWGGGSFVALAASLPLDRVRKAAGDGRDVKAWLLGLGVPKQQQLERLKAIFAKSVDDAEPLRLAALEAYEALRVDRVKREAANAQTAKETKERARQKLLAEELEIDQRLAWLKGERRERERLRRWKRKAA